MRAIWRSRVAALLACLMLAPATYAATTLNAAEMTEQFIADWGHQGWGVYFIGAPDKDCSEFDSQAEAQEHFESYVRPARDPHELDRDGDLIACERFRY